MNFIQAQKAQGDMNRLYDPRSLIVPIREKYRFKEAFGTKISFKATAIILSYVSTKKTIYLLLQVLSNTSRAYCFQEKPVAIKTYVKEDPPHQKTWDIKV